MYPSACGIFFYVNFIVFFCVNLVFFNYYICMYDFMIYKAFDFVYIKAALATILTKQLWVRPIIRQSDSPTNALFL